MSKSKYAEKLKDPRWQKKRLQILSRDEWTCQSCFSEEIELHIHHIEYRPGEPWEIDDEFLITLCKDCHVVFETKGGGRPYVHISWNNDRDMALCYSDSQVQLVSLGFKEIIWSCDKLYFTWALECMPNGWVILSNAR
jgi:hypothetical protein